MGGTLTHAEAKAFYDRFGARQDRQGFYEDRATGEPIVHGDFGAARSVFEFSCGTGRFAARLLADHLPPEASYRAVDISTTMVDLARARLAPWCGRAEVSRSSGALQLTDADAAYHRLLANFVSDLLSDADIRDLLAEAQRVLLPGGLLCLTGLTRGRTGSGRLSGRREALTMPRIARGVPPARPSARPLARRIAHAISMGHYQRDLV